MKYLSVCFGDYGLRGIGWKFVRPKWDEAKRDGVWYPLWALHLGLVNIRWLECYRETVE